MAKDRKKPEAMTEVSGGSERAVTAKAGEPKVVKRNLRRLEKQVSEAAKIERKLTRQLTTATKRRIELEERVATRAAGVEHGATPAG